MNADATISTPTPGQAEFVERWLTGSQRKTAFALRQNCENMIAGHSRRRLVEVPDGKGGTGKAWITDTPENLQCTGFLTLTVGDIKDGKFQQVFDAKEASRRINNLNRRVLKDLFERSIVVTERHKNGAIHFHVLGILRGRPDIRTGFDFAAVKRRDYRSVGPVLRGLWEKLRADLTGYGFGRSELTPIKSTGEAVACYISKYIEKNVCNRLQEDARKKLVRYVGWDKGQLKPNEFSWATERAIAWRGKAREIASLVHVTDKAEWGALMGPRWAFFVTRMMHGAGDTVTPFLMVDWGEREVLRAEVVREIGRKKVVSMLNLRLQFSDEMRDLRSIWPENDPEKDLDKPENDDETEISPFITQTDGVYFGQN